MGTIRAGAMELRFVDEELRALCSTRTLLRARFGRAGSIVERRLMVLSNAKMLGEVTIRPPDRRRREPGLGPAAVSVCAKTAGRIYFKALGIEDNGAGNWEEVKEIEIFAIREAAE